MTTNDNITVGNKKKRIEYIDAMRGFTMLLVVYAHIQVTSYHILVNDINSFNTVFVKFRMPLFFFISGWVLYKKKRIWDFPTSKEFITKKFKVQIISTIIFFLLFIFLFNLNFYKAIGSFKAGYWFTYSLFFYFIFYVLSVNLSRFIRNGTVEDIIVIFIAFLVLFCYFIAIKDGNQEHQRIYEIVGVMQWRYYVFFCFGTFVKKYFDKFVDLSNNSILMAIVVCTFFLLLFFSSLITLSAIETITYFLYGFLGIVIIFTVFRKNENWFATNQNISKWMQYVGRHTLDIYFLHYFFLPRNLEMIGDFFKEHNNPTIEFFVSCTLALMVIAVCLLVSKVLCVSPTLGMLLFGKKQ